MVVVLSGVIMVRSGTETAVRKCGEFKISIVLTKVYRTSEIFESGNQGSLVDWEDTLAVAT